MSSHTIRGRLQVLDSFCRAVHRSGKGKLVPSPRMIAGQEGAESQASREPF